VIVAGIRRSPHLGPQPSRPTCLRRAGGSTAMTRRSRGCHSGAACRNGERRSGERSAAQPSTSGRAPQPQGTRTGENMQQTQGTGACLFRLTYGRHEPQQQAGSLEVTRWVSARLVTAGHP